MESVVRLEANTKIWQSLQRSQVLSVFKNEKPLIAGTFPLGVFNQNSDLDILLSVDNIEKFVEKTAQHFSRADQFKVSRFVRDEQQTVIINFSIDQVEFELFAQSIESVKQIAYQHFLIEEKLLKYGGRVFSEKIKALRSSGLKTEAAFAKALNLSGDPYEALLALQTKSLEHLKNTLAQASI